MPRFAANLSLMYCEFRFEERFAAAASDGFKAVEFLFPYAYDREALAGLLQSSGLQQVLFNAPPGGLTPAEMGNAFERGLRGTACLPGRVAEFRAGVKLALSYAQSLNCSRLHLMAGLLTPDIDPAEAAQTYFNNLCWAAEQAARYNVMLLIEPINTRDMPGYYLTHQHAAHAMVEAVGAPNLKVQMDLYHCQIMEGDITTRLRRYVPTGAVGHIQIASVPDRHEPDEGELNFPYLFELLDDLGYEGWVGCEYRPRAGKVAGATRAGLGWAPWHDGNLRDNCSI